MADEQPHACVLVNQLLSLAARSLVCESDVCEMLFQARAGACLSHCGAKLIGGSLAANGTEGRSVRNSAVSMAQLTATLALAVDWTFPPSLPPLLFGRHDAWDQSRVNLQTEPATPPGGCTLLSVLCGPNAAGVQWFAASSVLPFHCSLPCVSDW